MKEQRVGSFWANRTKNDVYVRIELRDKPDGRQELSICGTTYKVSSNGIRRESSGGQNISDFEKIEIYAEPFNYTTVQLLIDTWKRWRLNDLRAGTPLQEKVLRDAKKATSKDTRFDYDWACDVLKAAGCYVDNGYRYGTKWLYEPLPEGLVEEFEACGFTVHKIKER